MDRVCQEMGRAMGAAPAVVATGGLLNIIAQVANVCRTGIVQDAWRRKQPLAVHGWIYSVGDGLLRDLDVVIESEEQIPAKYRTP